MGDKQKPGILRLDITKPRRSSGGSVEFCNEPKLLGEAHPDGTSPTVTSPQLSVTWRFPQGTAENQNSPNEHKSPSGTHNKRRRISIPDEINAKRSDKQQREGTCMDVSSPTEATGELNSDEEEDYSVSVSAIMQRRASVRGGRKRGSRRTSSPMGVLGSLGVDRRRSSVYTTSSGDTAISFDDGANQESTQEQIFENIRLHKEVLQSVKLQPWSMRRKLKLVAQAKEYIARHEGALQERFAMSRSGKDLMARFKILIATRLQHYRRELTNISTVLIPWEIRIKEIESHFGSVVASYFTFLRWLFWVNIVIAIVLIVFVCVPEMLLSEPVENDDRKQMLPAEVSVASNLMTIWDFEGYLRYSPLFYGYYSDVTSTPRWGYKIPLAYFLTGVAVYIYSFVATLRKMAENSRMSKLSSKDDECVFSWKLFTGWDFMIGHTETAQNRIASCVLGFKEALLEEAEKNKDSRNWRVIAVRGLVNIVVTTLLGISAYAVIMVVERSNMPDANSSWWRSNEITVVMTVISFFFPMFFEGLGFLESYHPRKQLRFQLARIMILNMLNLYSMIFALFQKINGMNEDLEKIKDELEEEERLEKEASAASATTPPPIEKTPAINDGISGTTSSIDNSTSPEYSSTTEYMATTLDDEMPSIAMTPISVDADKCYRYFVDCNKPNLNHTLIGSLLVLNMMMAPMITISMGRPTHTIAADDFKGLEVLNQIGGVEGDEYSYGSATDLPDGEEYDYYDYDTTGDRHRNGYTQIDNKHIVFDYETTTLNDKTTEGSKSTIGDTLPTTTDGSTSTTDGLVLSTFFTSTEGGVLSTTENDASTKSATTTTTASLTTEEMPTTTTTTTEKPMEETTTIATATTTVAMDVDALSKPKIYRSQNGSCFIIVCRNEDFINPISSAFPYSSTAFSSTTSPNSFTPSPDFSTEEVFSSTGFATSTTMTPSDGTTNSVVTEQDYEEVPVAAALISGDSDVFMPPPPTTEVAMIDDATQSSLVQDVIGNKSKRLDMEERKKLRKLCWETMFGQELVKLTVMDLIVTVLSTLMVDFFRALFVRYMNNCWCWDLEKRFPGYGDFKIAENILHLVNNQGMVWMGMFFSPGLAVINLVKLLVILYIRSWAVMTCNVPHEVVFRASRSNNFYLALLLTMLFLCVLPVAFAIVWLRPSWHCGPFSSYKRMYYLFTETLREALPVSFRLPLDYMASPSTVIPLLLLLILIIYYLVSLTGALREANQDLKTQLRRERSVERRKMLRPESKESDENNANNLTSRWKKVLEASSPVTPPTQGGTTPEFDETKSQARKDLLAKIMLKAMRKSSATSDDDSNLNEDDATDTEQNESLPIDPDAAREKRKPSPSKHRKKTPQMANVVPHVKNTHERHPKSKFKIEKESSSEDRGRYPDECLDDDDYDYRERVVSERRQSILRRQRSLNEQHSALDQEAKDLQYQVVNEKNSEAEKHTKKAVEPQVFKFDKADIEKKLEQCSEENSQNNENTKKDKSLNAAKSAAKDKGGVPPKEAVAAIMSLVPEQKPKPSKFGSIFSLVKEAVHKKTHSSGEEKSAGTTDKKLDEQKTQEDENKQTDEKPTETKPKSSKHTKKREPENQGTDTTNTSAKSSKSPSAKSSRSPSGKSSRSASPKRQEKDSSKSQSKDSSKSTDKMQQKESVKVEESTKDKKEKDGKMSGEKSSTKSESSGKKSGKAQKRNSPPRQDSQASIWSDNIPVITISKTESEECILEKPIGSPKK